MDLSKHLEYFDPLNDIKAPIHIIGVGAIGSTVAEMLTRMGVPELHIYDMDIVTPHNLANQMFLHEHSTTACPKESALIDLCRLINPGIIITPHGAYTNQRLAGYIFLCVDNIDLRREICQAQTVNPYIKAIFDFRMGLADAQHYAADWANPKHKENLLNTMQFTHAEAKANSPVNACGTSLNIIYTVRSIVSFGLANFVNFIKTEEMKKMILIDCKNFTIDAF